MQVLFKGVHLILIPTLISYLTPLTYVHHITSVNQFIFELQAVSVPLLITTYELILQVQVVVSSLMAVLQVLVHLISALITT